MGTRAERENPEKQNEIMDLIIPCIVAFAFIWIIKVFLKNKFNLKLDWLEMPFNSKKQTPPQKWKNLLLTSLYKV